MELWQSLAPGTARRASNGLVRRQFSTLILYSLVMKAVPSEGEFVQSRMQTWKAVLGLKAEHEERCRVRDALFSTMLHLQCIDKEHVRASSIFFLLQFL